MRVEEYFPRNILGIQTSPKGGSRNLLARLTRHQLKQDEFGAQMASWRDFLVTNRRLLSMGLAIGILALGAGFATYYFVRSSQNKAAAALAKAMDTYHIESYKTNDEKNTKALDEFSRVASDYSHYAAGRLARYYAAVCERDLGKFGDAEKSFQEVAAGSDKQLGALGKVGLASVYEQTNRPSDAEKIYKELEANPTETVPKATAIVARADLYSKTSPGDAAKLYQQLQKDYEGTPVADYAKQMLDKLPH